MGAATSKKKPLEEQRANLVLTLAERGLYGRIPKLVAPFLSYPYQPAVTTAEPGYVTRYWSLDEGGRASFVDPHEILREEIWSPEPARLPRWELEYDRGGHLSYVDTQSKSRKKHKKMPRNFINPMIEMSSVNSSCQAFIVACNKMFDAVYYEPLLSEAFDAFRLECSEGCVLRQTSRHCEIYCDRCGQCIDAYQPLMCCRKHDYNLCEACVAIVRDQANLVKNHGKAGAIEIFLDRGTIKRVRYANLSVIHRPNKKGGSLIKAVRKRAGITLIPWPEPVDQDFPGRSLLQPVDRSVVFKAPKRAIVATLSL